LLAIVIGIFFATLNNISNVPFLLIGAACYIYSVIRTLKNPRFMAEFNREIQFESIQDLNEECNRLYQNAFKRLPAE